MPPISTLIGQDGSLDYEFETQFPDPPLGCSDDNPKPNCGFSIPSFVPFLGGKTRLTQTQFSLAGSVDSGLGKGQLEIGAELGFEVGGQAFKGKASGQGDLRLNSRGLELTSAQARLQLSQEISREIGVLEAIPQLAPLSRFPGVRTFNRIAKLKGTVAADLGMNAYWRQARSGRLQFSSSTGDAGLKVEAKLLTKLFSDVLSAEMWVAGNGRLTVGVPPPLARRRKTRLAPR